LGIRAEGLSINKNTSKVVQMKMTHLHNSNCLNKFYKHNGEDLKTESKQKHKPFACLSTICPMSEDIN